MHKATKVHQYRIYTQKSCFCWLTRCGGSLSSSSGSVCVFAPLKPQSRTSLQIFPRVHLQKSSGEKCSFYWGFLWERSHKRSLKARNLKCIIDFDLISSNLFSTTFVTGASLPGARLAAPSLLTSFHCSEFSLKISTSPPCRLI